jgi:adenylate cyclase
MNTTPTRKLAAILAADVAGYSRLMRADETGTLTAMKALWAEVLQRSVRAHRGRVSKSPLKKAFIHGFYP